MGRACCGRPDVSRMPGSRVISFRPEDYAGKLEVVRSAASDTGRDPMSITPVGTFFVITGRSRDEIDEALDSAIVRSFALGAPAEDWARHGGNHPLGSDFSGVQDLIPQTLDEQTVLSTRRRSRTRC